MLALVFFLVLASAGDVYISPSLWWCLGEIESNNNDAAVGDDGKAIGRYQIWYVYWQDATSYDRSIGGVYTDCYNKEYSERVIQAYMNRYLPTGASDETIARTHNGGPNGANNDATIGYWNKVNSCLQG